MITAPEAQHGVLFTGYYVESQFEQAKGLIQSLDDHELAHEIMPVPSLGNVDLDRERKPGIVRDALSANMGQTIVFLDVSCRVVLHPGVFWEIPLEADIAVHNLNSNPQPAVMLLRNRRNVRKFVEEWTLNAAEGWEMGGVESRLVFQGDLIEQIVRGHIVVYDLPPDYCWTEASILTHGERTPTIVVGDSEWRHQDE